MADIAIAVAVVVCVCAIAIFLWALFGKHSSTSTKPHTTHKKHTTSTQHLGRTPLSLKTLETLYGKGTKEFKEAVERQRGYRDAMIASFRKNGMSESDITKKDNTYFGNLRT